MNTAFSVRAVAVAAVVLLCGCACRAALEDDGRWHISNAADMVAWFNTVQGQFESSDAVLDAHIDFDKTPTQPLGATSNGTCVACSGTFDGNNHTIKGLVINNAKSGNAAETLHRRGDPVL